MRKVINPLLLSFALVSCSTDENNGDNETIVVNAEEVKAIITDGEWRITFYADSDVDDTDNYNGYVFTFNVDGTLGATNGSTSLSGAWSITESENNDTDERERDVDFNIFFASPDIFEELANDWNILNYNDAKMELWDTSVDDGSTDYLNFEKT
ncbi:hypothetical protein [Ulvibacterium sp.]|uniref:hypothetical protein n=1 Tax=Ulvibacterium sp. TaxID=2665914 RepID=UPI002611064D|nr:hypothetical protein [Ulvibacterium sp.]